MILLLGIVTTSQFAFADGNDSPSECLGGATDETGGPTTIDVEAGFHISGICIKSGNEVFNNWKHSGLITGDGTVGDGDIPDDCYTIMGLETQTVTITETGNSACKEISHVDYFVEPWDMVGGYGGITDNTALLVSGSHLTASWMIPLLVSAIGIGIFVFTRK